MLALTLQNGSLSTLRVSDPRPLNSQILVRPIACGVCGSDLHSIDHGEEMWKLKSSIERDAPHSPMRGPAVDPNAPVVLGHEYSAEVVALGDDVVGFKPGDVVVSIPYAYDDSGQRHTLGYSSVLPGGFSEAMVLEADLALKVHPDLDPFVACLTEPFAVAVHAVDKANVRENQPIAIIGCGPIGLAILLVLRSRGHRAIVVSDPLAERRLLASRAEALQVLDPSSDSVGNALCTIGAGPPVVFEAVGKPGILDQILVDIPANSHLIAVGACLEPDTWRPMLALGRELTISFALGYSPAEFAASLDSLTSGLIDHSKLATRRVPLSGAEAAFAQLSTSPDQKKVLIT